ncbi:hypothetical protein F5Y16DRAFT_372620 [Xylariaceae sp. FL0255]|nr:hypothetical protein F5Y16DRAFT_372620 [Xylariaceae sp. FL0255]
MPSSSTSYKIEELDASRNLLACLLPITFLIHSFQHFLPWSTNSTIRFSSSVPRYLLEPFSRSWALLQKYLSSQRCCTVLPASANTHLLITFLYATLTSQTMMYLGIAFLMAALAAVTGAVPDPLLQHRSESYISTITIGAHPITYTPLPMLGTDQTPLTYGSPPTASKVPPGDARVGIVRITASGTSSTTASPSSSLTSSGSIGSVCTKVQGSYPASTLPGFCRPSNFVNAPALATPTGNQGALPTAVVTMGAESVVDKVTCCGHCAEYYNCYAWRFVPVYVGDPTVVEPGGFEPWKYGNCEIAYYTGSNSTEGVTTDCTASVCPNGRLLNQLNGTNNPQQNTWTDGLYYNGWNEGACGSTGDVIFEAGSDEGYGEPVCDA